MFDFQSAVDVAATRRDQSKMLLGLAANLADSVRTFRNEKLLGRLNGLRSTAGYSGLVDAWERFVDGCESALAKSDRQPPDIDPQLVADAESWRKWTDALKRIEAELPNEFTITMEMSPGDWSISLYDDLGTEIEIDDYESTEHFIRKAIDRAKSIHEKRLLGEAAGSAASASVQKGGA